MSVVFIIKNYSFVPYHPLGQIKRIIIQHEARNLGFLVFRSDLTRRSYNPGFLVILCGKG